MVANTNPRATAFSTPSHPFAATVLGSGLVDLVVIFSFLSSFFDDLIVLTFVYLLIHCFCQEPIHLLSFILCHLCLLCSAFRSSSQAIGGCVRLILRQDMKNNCLFLPGKV